MSTFCFFSCRWYKEAKQVHACMSTDAAAWTKVPANWLTILSYVCTSLLWSKLGARTTVQTDKTRLYSDRRKSLSYAPAIRKFPCMCSYIYTLFCIRKFSRKGIVGMRRKKRTCVWAMYLATETKLFGSGFCVRNRDTCCGLAALRLYFQNPVSRCFPATTPA